MENERLILALALLMALCITPVSAATLSDIGGPCAFSGECQEGYCLNMTCRFPQTLENYTLNGTCEYTAQCFNGYCNNGQCFVPARSDFSVFVPGLKSGCAAVFQNCTGLMCLACDMGWVLLIIGSLTAAYVARNRGRMLPVILFLLPLLAGFAVFALFGFILALMELCFLIMMRPAGSRPLIPAASSARLTAPRLTLPSNPMDKIENAVKGVYGGLAGLAASLASRISNQIAPSSPEGRIAPSMPDATALFKSSFEWMTHERGKRLAKVFFASEAIAMAIQSLLAIAVIAAMVALVQSSDLNALYMFSIPELTVMQAYDLIDLAYPAAAQAVIVLAAAVLALFALGGINDDVRSLLRTILPVRVLTYTVPTLWTFVASAVLVFVPSVLVQFSLDAVTIAVYTAAIIAWAYVGSFFVLSRLLSSGEAGAPFADASVKNVMDYIRFVFAYISMVLLNTLDRAVFLAQFALLSLAVLVSVFVFVLGNYLDTAALVLMAATAAYVISVMYNAVRLSPSAAVRILETDDARDSLEISWEYTRGHAIPIAAAMLGVYLVCAAAIAFAVTALSTAGNDLPLVTQSIANSLIAMFTTLVSAYLAVSVYLQLRPSGRGRSNSL